MIWGLYDGLHSEAGVPPSVLGWMHMRRTLYVSSTFVFSHSSAERCQEGQARCQPLHQGHPVLCPYSHSSADSSLPSSVSFSTPQVTLLSGFELERDTWFSFSLQGHLKCLQLPAVNRSQRGGGILDVCLCHHNTALVLILQILEVVPGAFGLDTGKNFFSVRVVIDWHRLPRGVVVLSSLEGFKNCGDVALRDVVMVGMGWWTGWS